jgi:hypothetical protein
MEKQQQLSHQNFIFATFGPFIHHSVGNRHGFKEHWFWGAIGMSIVPNF